MHPERHSRREGNVTALRSLLKGGLDPDAADESFARWTSVHWAALGGKLGCIKLLYEEGGCS